ncbi:hypothetical protein PRK78_002606 [Emydomyces testavorans]|uniref:Monooxygenase n=1 Tax=Emydomyces testavorans TaxID=2070801 RepID=A0AAF0IGM8_9EURO|nr:hypothetical protein PRK78_002606 [Emydomyces testavorans]
MDPNAHAQIPEASKESTKAAVVIIGAGISGLCIAINLLKHNINKFVILEKSAELGGTWRDNTYPGCSCDGAFETAHGYNYLQRIAEKYDLYRYIRFNSEVEESRWNDAQSKWRTKVKVTGSEDGEVGEEYSIASDFLVSGVGQLNSPKYPTIPGIETFKGKMMHSARWNWSYELKGKKIGIIGNGATAAQIIPEIAQEASHLTIFQRTPNWVIPRADMAVWKLFRVIFRYLPPTLWMARALAMDLREIIHVVMRAPNSVFAALLRKASLLMMHRALPNRPDMWKKLTPKYPLGCKRVILSDDYFPTLARENVSLETGHIDSLTEKGAVVDGVEQELDVLILATGFRTVDFMHPIKIYGRDGKPLSEIWHAGARALYGVTIRDLPNFAMLYGPNTNLGHNSIILMIEAQCRYILVLIEAVLRARERGELLAITPKPGKVEEFNSNLQMALSSTAFASPQCQSWYKTADGLIINNWSGTVVDYQKLLSKLDWNDFDLEGSKTQEMQMMSVMKLGRVREESLLGLKGLGITTASALAIASVLAYKGLHLLPRWR